MISELLNILNMQSATQVLVKTMVHNDVTQGNPIQREREPRRDSWGKINVQGTLQLPGFCYLSLIKYNWRIRQKNSG